MTISVSDAVELLAYAEPDSYNYNYAVNRLRADFTKELGMFGSVDGEYGWARRWAAASDGRDYSEHTGRAGFDYYGEAGFSVGIANDVTRRDYSGVPYSFWEEEFSIAAGHSFGSLGLNLANESGWTWYDSTGEVYTNLFENSTELSVELQPMLELTLRLGPQYALGRGLAGPGDDDYHEYSLCAGVDYFILDRLWLSVEDRIGRRTYPAADTTYQSNYVFNELTAFFNWTLLSGPAGKLGLEGMVNVSPEWHARQTDNFSLGVYSLEVKYGI
jgi:hypothetical protein